MGFVVFVLVAAVCLQGSAVLSQQQQQQQPYGFDGQAMWNPSSWAPYITAASKFWVDYAKKAQDATQQLHQQWDKTGAGNMFAVGMSYAQQAAKEAEKFAAATAQQAQKQVGQVPYF